MFPEFGWIGGPGGDLLSRALRHSTMGAGDFHGRVRDGIGCGLPAIATRLSNPPASGADGRRVGCGSWFWCALVCACRGCMSGALPRVDPPGACPRACPGGCAERMVCG